MQARHYAAEDIDFDSPDEAGVPGTEAFAAPMNFQPLSEESFVHMRTPSDADESSGAPAAL